jgi:hypothetical protein
MRDRYRHFEGVVHRRAVVLIVSSLTDHWHTSVLGSKEDQRSFFDLTLATELNVVRICNSELFIATVSDLVWQNPSSR